MKYVSAGLFVFGSVALGAGLSFLALQYRSAGMLAVVGGTPISAREADRLSTIRSIDFVNLFLTMNNGFYTDYYKEQCPGVHGSPIVIQDIRYADLTGDGREEAVVTASSCLSNPRYPDILGVFSRSTGGAVSRLRIDDREFYTAKTYAHVVRFGIADGKFVQVLDEFQKGDKDCCPSLGRKIVYFTWDGETFRVSRIARREEVVPEAQTLFNE